MGDSLGSQLAVSLQCEVESLFVTNNSIEGIYYIGKKTFQIIHQVNLSLRVGAHCNKKCLTDYNYRLNQSIIDRKFYGIHTCIDCMHVAADFNLTDTSNPKEFLPINKFSKFHWANNENIRSTGNILIFNTGSWYNGNKGMINSNDDYEKTIIQFAEVFSLNFLRIDWFKFLNY